MPLAVLVDVKNKKMGWGAGRKWTVLLAGDSPVHSSGRKAALEHAGTFAGKFRGTINVIDVGGAGGQRGPRNNVQPDLARIAQAGAGEAFLLRDGEAFWRHLIVSVFGITAQATSSYRSPSKCVSEL